MLCMLTLQMMGPADNKETIFKILTSLETEFREIRGQSCFLVVVGDGKTYQHLTELKHAYSKELSWLLPYPGDWHILKNFQPVLFKAYYDAGLKDIAQKCGFKASTLTSLSQCSNLRITHNFIMQVSEAIYRCMLATFTQHRNELDLCSFPSHHFLSARIEADIADQLEDCNNFSCPSDIRGIIIAIQNMLSTDFKVFGG